MTNYKQRIFELDALRGFCLIGMLAVHFCMDLQAFSVIKSLSDFFWFIADWGGILFIVLSGICVTLGHHPIRRGMFVLTAGMICTAVTVIMVYFGFDESVIIRFGILHLLGCCMLLSPLLNRLPKWFLPFLALLLIITGGIVADWRPENIHFLFPLGIRTPGFSSADYFPLLPNLGWFTVGIFLGKTLYAKKETLLPSFPASTFLIRFLCWCGRHSLWIYLLHQPILYGIFYLCL